jgi:Double zinc ribbon
MRVVAVFGIDNSGLNLAVNLLLLFVVVLWLSLIYWTYADAKRRLEDPMLIGCATAASIFPFVGTLVYIIVRPPEYLDDVRERELEIAAAEARLASAEHLTCPYCGFEIERSFLRCPSCLRRLKEPCAVCGRPLDPRWRICPYCEAEVGQPAPARPRTRRAAAAADPRAGAGDRGARAAVSEDRYGDSGRAPGRPAARAPSASRRPVRPAAERPAPAARERPPSGG